MFATLKGKAMAYWEISPSSDSKIKLNIKLQDK